MKGVIFLALRELVVNEFGEKQWTRTLRHAGIVEEPLVLAFSNVEDATVNAVLSSLCHVLGITMEQAGDAFGDYWVNMYAPRIYAGYFRRAKTARDFLLNMDQVHVDTTTQLADAKPPRFTYEWKDEHTLVMGYESTRNLIDIMVGLVKGVGKYYNEQLSVRKLGPRQVEISFQAS